MSRGALENRIWYFKQMYYGRIKTSLRLSIVIMAMALYIWYNK